jgi:Na+-transporting NADH:ubiquinone oxidoreductase subunit F
MELLFFLQVGGLSDYLNAIAVLGGLGAILGIMMAIVDATICNYGECNILINKDQKKIKVKGGENLLSTLFNNKIFIPSACGGQGTCGYCRLKVHQGGGPILPMEEGFFTKQEIRNNWRLSCQVKVKNDLEIEIPEEYFSIQEFQAKVVSNHNVSSYIKELVLELVEPNKIQFKAGQYIQFHIPAYQASFQDFEIDDQYKDAYIPFQNLQINNKEKMTYRAYSMASAPYENKNLMLNVRIATPPQGKKYAPGIGSTYIFQLKPNDLVQISGPYGNFLIKDTENEMMYIGGGAGMAPLRSHLFYLLKEQKTKRKITFWYGARSQREIFYQDEFDQLVESNKNFQFTIALSDKQPEDTWDGPEGFIHTVCDTQYLQNHPNPANIEYYLCGPQPMIDAVIDMLHNKYNVPDSMISFDKF